MDRIEIIQKNITRFKVGTIVSAANTSLLGGDEVDRTIYLITRLQLIKKVIFVCFDGKVYNIYKRLIHE